MLGTRFLKYPSKNSVPVIARNCYIRWKKYLGYMEVSRFKKKNRIHHETWHLFKTSPSYFGWINALHEGRPQAGEAVR